ncbi:hypothetical protein ACLOJK_007332 [Asimina triloba]
MARVRVEDFSVLATSRLLSALTGCRVGSSSVVSQFRSPASRPSPSAIDFCLNVVVLLLSDIFFPNGLIVVPSLSLSAVVPSLSLRSSFLSSIPPYPSASLSSRSSPFSISLSSIPPSPPLRQLTEPFPLSSTSIAPSYSPSQGYQSPLHPLTTLLYLACNLVIGYLPALPSHLLYLTDNHLFACNS